MQYCRVLIVVILTVLIALVFVYKFFINVIPNNLKIATGRESGGYYYYAKKYQKSLEKEGIQLEIIQTAGSLEALELLNKGEVDIAFVQGGTAKNSQTNNLLSMASLFYEPLWVFYNDDLSVKYLTDLKNKKVSIGEKGSGTRELFQILFEQNGIESNQLLALHDQDAVKKLQKKEIDALCLVISPEAPVIKELLSTNGIKLMNFNRKLAYRDRFDYINSVNLSEGVIDLARNIPNHDIKLLVTTASLVVKKDFNHNLQRLIIKNIKDIHRHGGIFEPENFFPSIQFVEIPISEHTKAYLKKGETWAEKYLPFWFSSLIEALLVVIVPLIPILIIFIKVVLPSYSLYFKYKIYTWENQIYLLDRKINNEKENKKEYILEEIELLKRIIKHSCVIYFFYTHQYYDLLLKLDGLRDTLLSKKMVHNHFVEYQHELYGLS
ncbi:TAXI family TRAP transporter solute-binding subunit [Candidatus Marinarcus aquaticus]|uniref:C4-dicarboxylate ABC transporter substrate-binding protein n=1 Tax=Candidatus Marinarcus aquaticus TaxID=2044504 RepID=A0A4Q0XV26_9BACT|nr:TAXI family TRAP transporter solute-binding subunit [Candidatus Marinarcus aquaticus]RXJ59999.1 hypothetical protein CRV04_03010 [Candidatus Marinarcus aquaticus]